MNKVKRNKLFSLLLILLLSYFKLKLLKRLKFILQKRVYTHTGLFINITNASLYDGFARVKFWTISIRLKNGNRVFIDQLALKFSIRKAFKNKSIYAGLAEFDAANIIILHSLEVKKNNENIHTTLKDSFLYEEKINPYYIKVINALFDTPLKKGKIETLGFFIIRHNKKHSLYVRNLFFEINSISGEVNTEIKKYLIKLPFFIDIDKIKKTIALKSNQSCLIQNSTGFTIAKVNEYNFLYSFVDNTHFNICGTLVNSFIHHKSFSDVISRIDNLNIEVYSTFTNSHFETSNESFFSINGICCSFNFLHNSFEQDLIRISSLLIIEGESFFKNYPFFILTEMRKIKSDGDLVIKIDYMTSLKNLAEYFFKASILENELRILDWGNFDLTYLNDEFEHKISTKGKKTQCINVSKKNNEYVKLDDIPSFLKSVVSQAEDPNYSQHFGIDPYFIGVAITKNILNKKFVKGASTITMQLVKNLLLSEGKSINRKLDEMIIAWLIENHFGISKNRILEIYLNIIEFGENIYGVSNACKYYFDKKLNHITLTESIVLSYIIPRPRYFLEAVLMQSDQLKKNLKAHIQYYSSILLRNKLITNEEYKTINLRICFKKEFGIIELS